MPHPKESAGVDLLVVPTPLTDQDRQQISAAIAAYKAAREQQSKERFSHAKTTG